MAAQIKVVEETDVPDAAPLHQEPARHSGPSPTDQLRQEIAAALSTLNARIAAVEGAVQSVPRALGVIQSLLRALGSRALMGLALLGCLALAGFTISAPTWQGIAITGMVIIGVFAPLAWINSRGG